MLVLVVDGVAEGEGRAVAVDAELGVHRVGDLARLDEAVLSRHFGKWGLALSGKAKGLDAGGWFDHEIGDGDEAKSLSHEHTFDVDTADQAMLESVLARMAEMVGRRLREKGLFARTVQLKLRDKEFRTITRAHTLHHRTQIDTELFHAGRELFRNNWKPGTKVRLIGLQASGLDDREGQLELIEGDANERWKKALNAADALRDRFGDSSVSLAASMKGKFRERVHETPAQRKQKPAGKPGEKRP